MSRRRTTILVLATCVPLLAVAVALALAPRIELGSFIARHLSATLDRPVTIASFRVIPRRSLRVELRDAWIGNIAGGSAPAMATVARLSVELEVLPLLRGRLVVRHMEVDGFALLLERTPLRRANWHFGPVPEPPGSELPRPVSAAHRPVPSVLSLQVSRSEVVFRTTSGLMLQTKVETARGSSAGTGTPIELDAEGSYNDVPLALRATLGSFDTLRDAQAPFPVTLQANSGETTFAFAGVSHDPLNVDRLHGRLTLRAPTPDVLLAVAGAGPGPRVSLEMSGAALREGEIWQLRDIEGVLDDAPFTGALIELTEGDLGKPDAVAATLAFTQLDFNRLLGPPGNDTAPGAGADMRLEAALAPDPLLRVDVSAEAFRYGALHATDAQLRGEVAPARITLEELSLFGFGAQLSSSVEVTPAENGAQLSAMAQLHESELDALRRSFGLGPLPVSGHLEGRLAVEANGTALNEALREARVSLVLAMAGGTVAREVIEMASTDIRALFRTARGRTPLTCLLAIGELRSGRGDIAPLRLRAGTGAITGVAAVDLNRRWLDMTIGSRSETTHFLALDIPVRISGSFDRLVVVPSEGPPERQARIAGAENVAALPPNLREFAESSACYRARTDER